jgi:hypothetical protein
MQPRLDGSGHIEDKKRQGRGTEVAYLYVGVEEAANGGAAAVSAGIDRASSQTKLVLDGVVSALWSPKAQTAKTLLGSPTMLVPQCLKTRRMHISRMTLLSMSSFSAL